MSYHNPLIENVSSLKYPGICISGQFRVMEISPRDGVTMLEC